MAASRRSGSLNLCLNQYHGFRTNFYPKSSVGVNGRGRETGRDGTGRPERRSSGHPVPSNSQLPPVYGRLRFFSLVRCTSTRRSDEQFLAVFERNVAAVRPVRAILGLIPFHEDFSARQQRG